MTIPMNLKQILRDPNLSLRLTNDRWEIYRSEWVVSSFDADFEDVVLATGDNLEECNMNFTKWKESQDESD